MQRRFTGLLLRPSLFSAFVTSLLAIGLVSISNWSYVLEHVFFYDYLFGTEGLVTNVSTTGATNGFHDFSDFLGNSFSYNIIILCIAIMVGVVVYLALQVLGRVANDASATWESLHGQNDKSVHSIMRRWVIRSIIALTWIIYWMIFTKLFMPFCILAVQVGIRQLWSLGGIGYIAFGTILTWVIIHMHVIFMRLVLLRPRVFGGNDEVLAYELGRK